jgi:predicted nucleic acid-binding protein
MIRVVIDTNVVVSANLKDEGLPAARDCLRSVGRSETFFS